MASTSSSNSSSSLPTSPSKSILKRAKTSKFSSTDNMVPPLDVTESPKRAVKWSEEPDQVGKTWSSDDYQRDLDMPASYCGQFESTENNARRMLLRPLAARCGVDMQNEDWYLRFAALALRESHQSRLPGRVVAPPHQAVFALPEGEAHEIYRTP